MGLLLFTGACATPPPVPVAGAPPLVIAHRGASAEAPENTLASYSLAIEQGAQLAECDVYLTRDGVPILFHDRELDRTTDGAGPVEGHSLAELKALDAGSWKDVRYAGEPIPTLVEFLLAVKDKLRPVIEIKGKDRGIEAAVIAALRASEFPSEQVMIFSFHRKVVAEIARLDPLLPTTWLLSLPENRDELDPLFREALRARVSAIGVHHKDVGAALLRRAHESGLPVFVWTVNDEESLRRLAGLGVDAIITDRPGFALEILGT